MIEDPDFKQIPKGGRVRKQGKMTPLKGIEPLAHPNECFMAYAKARAKERNEKMQEDNLAR
ncbi:MAG: hypothetical protein WBK55_10550 [Alphaproteobacteria bacterium]